MTIANSNQKVCCGKTKRTDFEYNDAVTLLNELGMQRLQDGKTIEAKQSFARALFQTSSFWFSGSNAPPFLISMSCGESASGEQEATSNGQEQSTFYCSTSSSSSVDKSLYIYQREFYDEGMHVFREALHINKDLPRPVLDSTLLYNVGQAYVRSNQYSEGRRWFSLALSLLCGFELSGHNFEISCYKIQHNLGYCCYCLGDNNQAMIHYQEALDLVGKLGLGKLDMAESCNCVAVLQFHSSPTTPDTALELLQVSINTYRLMVGDSTPQLATFLSNVGRVYYMMSDYDKSLACFQEALAIRECVLGSNSIDVATAIFNMGQTFHRLAALGDAKNCYVRFLDLAKEKLGTVHRDVAAALKSLADVHREEGDLSTALSLLKESLENGRASLGAHHPELTSTLNDLGSLCYEQNMFEEALPYYEECLTVQRKVLEQPGHPHIIITLLNIAQIQKQSGDCDAAFLTYRDIYALQMNVSAEQDVPIADVASTLSSMGLMKYLVRDFRSALNFYNEALRLRRHHFGRHAVHADIASTLNSIGLVQFKLNQRKQAIEAFVECLQQRKQILGPNHRDIAILYYNVATVLLEFGDDQSALKFYKESLRVEQNVLGHDHPEVAETLKHLGQVLQEQGDLVEALRLFTEALEILRNDDITSKVESDAAISQLLNLIGDIHLMNGNINDMMKCFAESCLLMGQDGLSLTIAGHSFYDLTQMHPPCAPTA